MWRARTQTPPPPDTSLALLRAELLRFQRWVYQVLLRTHLIPPVTIFLVVALGGLRKRGSWYVRGSWQAGEQRCDEICLAGEGLADPVGALAWVLLSLLEQAAAAAADPPPRHGRRPYRRLKAAAEALGLHLQRSRGGRWVRASLSGELRQRIETEFVPNWAAFAAVRDAPRGPSRPRPPRWQCACPRPRSHRRVRLNARCLICGLRFRRMDPWPPPRPQETFGRSGVQAFGRSPEAAVPQPRMPHSEGNSGTAEPWNGGTPRDPPNARTPERPNPRTMSASAVSGVAPAASLEPVYAEGRHLLRYTNVKLFTHRPLQYAPEVVIQAQGSRKTVTWFRPATWHGDGPSRPEIGIAAEALRDPPAVYAGILHELVHQWAWENGIRDVNARRNYHTVAFRDIAERIGLVVQRAGGTGWAATSLSEELRQALAEDFQWNLAAFAAFRDAPPGPPGLPRWQCRCPITLRGSRVAIHCHDCRTDFAPALDAEATSLVSLFVTARTPVHPNARTFLPLSNRPPPRAPVAP